MRVISQNGAIDVPYEIIALHVEGGIIRMNMKGSVMALYSTEEKAEKAMEMLHDKWLSHMMLEGGPCTTSECYVQPNYWVLPKVFQFPSDDEV